MLKLCVSFATSASASLILSSASYLLDLVLDLDQLLVRVLDLLEVVLVRGLVHRELLLVLLELRLGLGQLEREAAGGLAITGLEVGLGLRAQLR